MQALSDLKLIREGKVTNAAMLLVGKEEAIAHHIPQAKVMLEYRNSESQINYDNRKIFGKPFFLLIDELWDAINQRNGSVPVREGAYIFDIPFFNEDVIREVVNNAFAHRDYSRQSEIVVKQYPTTFSIVNAGGFPQGVELSNILTVPSTPRNRLLADVLSKTGIVERSGQGIDKIFLYTLSEGKPAPDYASSDTFTVTATLSANVKDTGFAIFIQGIQQELPDNEKLSVFDVMALCELRDGAKKPSDPKITQKLEQMGYIEKHGKTNAIHYTLPRRYYELTGNLAMYSMMTDWNREQVWAVLLPYLQKYGKAKKADMMKLLGDHISEKQLRNYIDELKEIEWLKSEGVKGQTTYHIGDRFKNDQEMINKALLIGLDELKKKGEL